MSLFRKAGQPSYSYRRSDGHHRRQRIVTRRLLRFMGSYLGDQVYYIGCSMIRARRNFFRRIRHFVRRVLRWLGRNLKLLFGYIRSGLVSVAADLTNPFRKLWRSGKSLMAVLQDMQGMPLRAKLRRVQLFWHYGWMWNSHLVERFASYVLPAVCLALCVFTVKTLTGLNYAIEVSYNGQQIGYVADESVYDSAVKIIGNRIISVDEDAWQPSATLTIAACPADSLSTQDTMANSLLSASGTEIVEATGLYIGGEFYGATTAGEMLQQTLDDIIAPFEAQAQRLGDDASVKFSRDVQLVSGIYPSDSVVSYDRLHTLVTSSDVQDIYYTAAAGESVAAIALANGLTVSELQEMNPETDLTQQLLEEGSSLLVARAEPLISVKTVRTITKVSTIAFDTIVTKDNRFNVGYYWVVSQGESGERTTVTEVEYKNGVEINRTVVSELVTKEPIHQEIVIGTKSTGGGSSVGTGSMVWPTAGGYSITRGFTAGHHLGVDIAAARGTEIYAADSGVVTVATSIPWDYGTYCIIDHQNGIVTVYGHCSVLLVEVGDVVQRGQVVALMGSTGNSTGNHLHFETRVGGIKVDPYIYLYG